MERENSVRQDTTSPVDVSQDLLPQFQPQELEMLEKDRHDPLSKKIILEYNRYIEARRKFLSQIDRTLRQHGIKRLREELASFERLLEKKRYDDSLLVEFDSGQYVVVDIVGVKNLPPTTKRKDLPTSYCTVMMVPPKEAKPALDGLKTVCNWCKGKKAAEQQDCRRHMTNVSPATTNPTFGQKFKFKVNPTSSEIVICVYNSTSVGAHELIGWFHMPSYAVLYSQTLEREYVSGLMDEHEIPIQTSVLGDDFMEYQSKNPAESDLLCYLKLCKMPGWAQNLRAVMQITIRWRVQIPKKKYFDKFQAPSTSTKKWNGWHFKRWDSGIRYVGEWEDGLPHGKGKYYGIDGGSYEGDWARGVIHGKGTFLFANGDTYSGQWRLGFRHGHGRSEATNGDVYEGNWRFGTQHGFGRHCTSEGEEYVGEWKSNFAHGTGTFKEASGLKWDGVWYEGRVCYRGDDRPPTPPGHVSKIESRIVQVDSDDMVQHNLPAMNIRMCQTLGSRDPIFFPDGFHLAKTHAADALLFGEEPEDLPTCFFDRNKAALLEMPCFNIEMRRTIEKDEGHKEEFRNRRRRLPVGAKPDTRPESPLQTEPGDQTPHASPASGWRLPGAVTKGSSVKQLLAVTKGASVKQLLKKLGSSKLLSFPFAKARLAHRLALAEGPGEGEGLKEGEEGEEGNSEAAKMGPGAQTDPTVDETAVDADHVSEADVKDSGESAAGIAEDSSPRRLDRAEMIDDITSQSVDEIKEEGEVVDAEGSEDAREGERAEGMVSPRNEDQDEVDGPSCLGNRDARTDSHMAYGAGSISQSQGAAAEDGQTGSGEEDESGEEEEEDEDEDEEDEDAGAKQEQREREPSRTRRGSSFLYPSDKRGCGLSEDGSESSGGASSHSDAKETAHSRTSFAPLSTLKKLWRGNQA